MDTYKEQNTQNCKLSNVCGFLKILFNKKKWMLKNVKFNYILKIFIISLTFKVKCNILLIMNILVE